MFATVKKFLCLYDQRQDWIPDNKGQQSKALSIVWAETEQTLLQKNHAQQRWAVAHIPAQPETWQSALTLTGTNIHVSMHHNIRWKYFIVESILATFFLSVQQLKIKNTDWLATKEFHLWAEWIRAKVVGKACTCAHKVPLYVHCVPSHVVSGTLCTLGQ